MAEILAHPWTVMIILIFGLPIVAVIAHYWHEVLKTRSDNQLKQSMLDRGMSAEEIEQVMNAGNTSKKRGAARCRSADIS